MTLNPPRASPIAALNPAAPAPTTITSYCEKLIGDPRLGPRAVKNAAGPIDSNPFYRGPMLGTYGKKWREREPGGLLGSTRLPGKALLSTDPLE